MTGPRLRKRAEANNVALVTTIADVDKHMAQARDAFATALLAHIRARPDAALRTREALDHVDAARARLRALAKGEG